MKNKVLIGLWLLCFSFLVNSIFAQPYTSYFTGDPEDVNTLTDPGICLMGGASEHDQAMIWFLEKSVGGDIVVIRASGSDAYNNYFYSDLGVEINSVETIIIDNPEAANHPYVKQQLSNAEAIWIAGGDQYDYVSNWKNSGVDSILNAHVNIKQAPIGGTSAGMAILGSTYFSAENGTVTSEEALNDPYDFRVAIGKDDFLQVPYLNNVITDTHYDNPERMGRHMVFLSRLAKEDNVSAFGIACDEYTAVCIAEDGKAYVFGDYPAYDDNAWFIQANCEGPISPETCEAGVPLNWNRGQRAVKAYNIKGDWTGTHYFDLNSWEFGTGGSWENWYVADGVFSRNPGTEINCSPITDITELPKSKLDIFPQPASSGVYYTLSDEFRVYNAELFDLAGRRVFSSSPGGRNGFLDLSTLNPGMYILNLITSGGLFSRKLILEK